MSYVQTVTAAANKLKLLDGAGKLLVLDSLSLLDLITELESMTEITIPIAEIRGDVFSSVEGIAGFLSSLAPT